MDLLTIVFFIGGFLLVLFGADLLVRGASRLAIDIGISPLVVGLTIVAYGTSAPELAISLQAIFDQQPDISLGNIVGSNVTNILLVLGLAATFRALPVSRRIMRLDLPLMLGASFALFAASFDGIISSLEGGAMMVIGIAYTWHTIRKSRREHREAMDSIPEGIEIPETSSRPRQKLYDVGMLLVGAVMLILGSNALVGSSVTIAEHFGVSKIIIGLTIIAIGTSLPEVATTFVAGAKGELDIAVGNAIGSNIMNILFVIGAAGLFASEGIAVQSVVISTDLPLMIGVALLCTAVIFNGFIITRREGVIFLGYFAFYLVYLVARSSSWTHLPTIHILFLYVCLPLTIIYFGVGLYHTVKKTAPATKSGLGLEAPDE